MAKLARDLMTTDPACCSPETTLDEIAQLMVENNCGEIPIVDRSGCLVGVITDRDIVCRVVARGENPADHTAETCMSTPVFAVRDDATVEDVVGMMESHQVRRVPVVDGDGCCAGIIAQADLVSIVPPRQTSELLSQISRESARPSM